MKIQYAPADVIEQLVNDLRLAEAGHIAASDLNGAPLLHDYQVVPSSVGFLKGIVENHPKLPTGREIKTSQLYFIDTDLGIARTLNRWYRLESFVRTGGH